VRYPHDALLAILRIEADRAGAWVVGEDMGTVPENVQPMMADIDMLGYRAACRVPISMFTVNTLGATGTHDHATIAGILTGQDPRDMVSVGKSIDPDAEVQRKHTLALEAGLEVKDDYTDDEIATAVVARCASVANSASRVVVFNLEDVAAVRERPNMPGTIDQWPNWRWALPIDADELLREPLAVSIAATARATRHL
jgi:4-alpha-glucanotransferase